VFDSFGPSKSAEDSLNQVGLLVGIMGILGFIVWVSSYLSFYFQQKGSMSAVRHIKKAFFNAVLLQESAWFD